MSFDSMEANITPLRYFAIDSDFVMVYLGVFNHPADVFKSNPPSDDIVWILDETSAEAWLQELASHPDDDAWFGVSIKLNGKLLFLANTDDEMDIQHQFELAHSEGAVDVGNFDQFCMVIPSAPTRLWRDVVEEAGVTVRYPPAE